jgi:hypothetical protein
MLLVDSEREWCSFPFLGAFGTVVADVRKEDVVGDRD